MKQEFQYENNPNLSKRVNEGIKNVIREYTNSIRWKKVALTIPMPPTPSKRGRVVNQGGFNRIYVPGAAANAAFFDKHVRPYLKKCYIDTPCEIWLDIYIQTPKSWSQVQKELAEIKLLRPWVKASGDIDNYEKAVYDMIQTNEKRGHVGIMSEDCLIIDTHPSKYYSDNPRYEVIISYMDNIPESLYKKLKIKKEEGD